MDGENARLGVEGVIITGDLDRRFSRAPDYEAESQAFASLAEAMGSSPRTVLQQLVGATMELTGCDSAGISILEPGGEQGTFRWVATAGAWAPYRDGTMPREESPCGEVVAREAVLLVREPQRAFPALLQAEPGIGEGLLAPFTVDGVPTGTVWAIKHGPDGRFEAEDARLLKRLARFASVAHQMVLALSQAQASGQESEARYRSLFETMGQGYALVELVRDASGKAVDQRYIDFNPAIERLLGVAAADTIGKLASEVFPGIEPWWTATFEWVVREGRPERIEHFFEPLGRWFEVYAYPAGGDRFTTLYEDVTERRHAEAALRESEQRQVFLLRLTDAIRSEPSERAVVERALVMLAEELAVDRCYATRLYPAEDLTELVHEVRNPGLVPMPSTFRNSDFPEAFQQTFDRTLVFDDTANDPALADADKSALASMSFGAFLSRPLRRDGTPLFSVGVVSSCPRRWTHGEIILVEEVTERTWAAVEQARAEATLQESAKRQAFVLRLSDALRAEPTADSIANRALRMLSEQMRLDRCYVGVYRLAEDIGEFPQQVHDDRLPPLPAQVRLSDFPEALRVAFDRTLVVDDVVDMRGLSDSDRASFHGLGLRGLIAATLRKGENNPLWAIVAVSTCARVWTPGEVALVEEVTERTWAAIERARVEGALRDSEERQAFQLRLSDALASLTNPADIQAEAARLLAGQLNVSWCYFNEFDDGGTHATVLGDFHRDGLPSMKGVHDLSRERDFLDLMGSEAMLDMPDLTSSEQFSVQAKAAYGALGLRSALGAPLLRNGRLAAVLLVADTSVRLWTRGDTQLLRGVVERTWAAIQGARSEAALRDSEERFLRFSDASTSILWIRDAATLRMEFASPAFDTIYGIPGPDRGGDPNLRTWARLIEPESRKDVFANFRRVRAGERIEVEFRIKRASDGALRWVHNTDFPLRDAAGNVRWLAGLGADITDAKEAGDRQGVLVAELQHRTRNLIAVVRSLSDRTLGNAASLEDFGKRFRPRLAALSRVQGLLSHLAAGERVTFKELLEAELAAHGVADWKANKLTLDGPSDVPLRSATVQTFALALHELATNAIKYGAFAASEGHLTVRWHVEPASGNDPPRLHVEWRESGVSMPQVGAPARGGGYGRELIERALPYQLTAKTSYELGADGVRCTIAVPISRVTAGVSEDE